MKIHPTFDHLQFIEFEAKLRFLLSAKGDGESEIVIRFKGKTFPVKLNRNTLNEAKQIDGYEQIWMVKNTLNDREDK